jgi:NAD(P)-dependent dehydrogenase (short-subunit alcohol dehydrogenase family)
VIGLTKSCARDYGAHGIRCNAVCPSFVKTPMTTTGIPDPEIWDQIAAGHPIGRLVTAEEVAASVLFLLATGGITGATYMVDGGISIT